MRKRMVPLRGALSSQPLTSSAAPSSSPSSSSSHTGMREPPQIEGTPLLLPASPPRGSSPALSPDPIHPPDIHPARRRRIEAAPSGVERGAMVPVVGPPGCPACSVFVQSLGYIREDRDKIREELERARISERVAEERRRIATVESRRLEDAINDMRLAYDRLREECHALHLRMDASHDPSLITGGRLVLNSLLGFGVITREIVDSCGMSHFLGPD